MTTATAQLRPPFAYAGGKALLAPTIAAMLPPHRHYVEPFAGGLSVLLAKAPSRQETVNDLDGELMAFWRTLRDHPEELARVCALTPHSRAERTAALDRPDDLSDLERARRVWVCLAQGRAGTLRTTGWRHDAGDEAHISMPRRLDGYITRMEAVATRLRRVSLECRPALEIIGAYGGHRGTLLYVDPPYLGDGGRSRLYRHEMMGEAEHRELAAALSACKATVVLSGYASELYDQLYGGWHRTELASATSQGGQREPRTEVLWSNRPLSTACNGTSPMPMACNETPPRCPVCGGVVRQAPTGRPARFCSGACRVRAHRQARAS